MKPTVIALLARAGSGKTTAADYLVGTYGAKKISFAGPLKVLAKTLFDMSDEQVYGSLKEVVDGRYQRTPRQLMQLLGNEARKTFGTDIWIKAAMQTVKEDSAPLYVIDDCRYVNEAVAIHNAQDFVGHVVKINCPDRHKHSSADPNHPSEAQVDLVPEEYIFSTILNTHVQGISNFKDHLAGLCAAIGVKP